MKWLYKFFEKYYDQTISSAGLGLFRIFFGLVILLEAIIIYQFRYLVFAPREPVLTYILIAWFPFIIMLILGLFTRIATIGNYMGVLACISSLTTYEYHHDYVVIGVSFLMLMVPMGAGFSLDNLLKKLVRSTNRSEYKVNHQMPYIYYLLFIFVGIALVYFDSIFYKWSSPMWRGGLGLWFPASMPVAINRDMSFLLDQYWLVYPLGIVTIIFETIFIVAMWFRKLNPIMFLVGIGLHVGIVVFFPIPLFGLGVTALYLLLIPETWWFKVADWLKVKSPRMTVFYDGDCPLCLRTKITVQHFDFRNAIEFKTVQASAHEYQQLSSIDEKELINDIFSVDNKGQVAKGIDTYRKILFYMGFTAPLALFFILPPFRQIAAWVYRIVASNRARIDCNEEACAIEMPFKDTDVDSIKISRTLTWKNIKVSFLAFVFMGIFALQLFYVVRDSSGMSKIARAAGYGADQIQLRRDTVDFAKMTCAFMGITTHGVFMDNHFAKFNHLIGVTYIEEDGSETWLPMSLENGGHGPFAQGRFWVKWTFRVNSQNVRQHILKQGLRQFTREWARQNDIPLDGAKFKVKVKVFDRPAGWTKGHLKTQLQEPWQTAGQVSWEKGRFKSSLANIESLIKKGTSTPAP